MGFQSEQTSRGTHVCPRVCDLWKFDTRGENIQLCQFFPKNQNPKYIRKSVLGGRLWKQSANGRDVFGQTCCECLKARGSREVIYVAIPKIELWRTIDRIGESRGVNWILCKMFSNHEYLRHHVNNWERTNRTRLIQSIIISAMFCLASLTNLCNVVLNSKVEHTIEDALLRYVELRTSLMFYWRSCMDAQKNLKSLSPFVTS